MTDYYEDACYLSNSEAEPDSEAEECSDSIGTNKPAISSSGSTTTAGNKPEQLNWDETQALLNTWMGELDSLQAVSAKPFTFVCFTLQFTFHLGSKELATFPCRRHFCLFLSRVLGSN